MKNLTICFLFIFVLILFTSCDPEEVIEVVNLEEIGDSGDQEDVPDDEKK